MTSYPTQSHYPDTEPTSPNNTECLANKQQATIFKSLALTQPGLQRVRSVSPDLPKQPSRLVDDSEPNSPCPILIMPRSRLGSDKYQFYRHLFDSTRDRTCRVQNRTLEARILRSSNTGNGCSATPSGTLCD